MTQNINLLQPGLRQVQPRLSLMLLLKCLGGVVALTSVAYVFLQFQVSSLNGELRRVQELVKVEQAEALKAATQAAAGRKPDPQVEAEIVKLQSELRQAQDTVAALKGGSFGDRRGFAQYLRAFSRQSLDGLWLTGFTISGSGDIEISGRALRPDLVPAYIQRLNEEDVLAGQSFARLEMSRPEAETAKSSQSETSGDKKPPPLAPYVEFTLGTREAVKLVEKAQ